jgi:hypothetical protein
MAILFLAHPLTGTADFPFRQRQGEFGNLTFSKIEQMLGLSNRIWDIR